MRSILNEDYKGRIGDSIVGLGDQFRDWVVKGLRWDSGTRKDLGKI